ncbi:MAG: tyrosine-type recombinase/integrase [Shewanella algae]
MAAMTAKAASEAKPKDKNYKLFDEKGLFLLVKTNGRKYWRLKYRHLGKEKALAIGVYPDVSLKGARVIRDEARNLIAQGLDPNEERKQANLQAMVAAANSFEVVASEWLNVRSADKSPGYKERVKRALEMDIFPMLGKHPISEINAPKLLAVLRLVEKRGALETAHKLKTYVSQIFRFAIASGLAERDPAVDLRGALATREVNHRAAIITPAEVGRLMVRIDAFDGTATVRNALKLSALFFCRPGELRQLEWSEVNWDEKLIEIPASKMKMREAHIIPLCEQAIKVLHELYAINSRSKFIFPSARGASRSMSENAVRTALRTMGYTNEDMTPHGFRAMARTLLDEVLGYRIEWIEQQLAHAVKDANGRAYNRTKHLHQRFEMMQRWADYLDVLRVQAAAGNVIVANFAKCQG